MIHRDAGLPAGARRIRRRHSLGNEGPAAHRQRPEHRRGHGEDTAGSQRQAPAEQFGQGRRDHGGDEGADVQRRRVDTHRRTLAGGREVAPDDQRDDDVAYGDRDAQDHGAEHDEGAAVRGPHRHPQEHAEQGERDRELRPQLPAGQGGQRRGQGEAQHRDAGEVAQFRRRKPEVLVHGADHGRHRHEGPRMFRAISPIAASRIQPLGPLEGMAAVMRWPRLPGLELEVTFISSIAITAGAALNARARLARAEGAGCPSPSDLHVVPRPGSRAPEVRPCDAPSDGRCAEPCVARRIPQHMLLCAAECD